MHLASLRHVPWAMPCAWALKGCSLNVASLLNDGSGKACRVLNQGERNKTVGITKNENPEDNVRMYTLRSTEEIICLCFAN